MEIQSVMLVFSTQLCALLTIEPSLWVKSRGHPLTLFSPVDTSSTVQLSSPEDIHSHCPALWTPPQQSNCPVQRTPTHTVQPSGHPLNSPMPSPVDTHSHCPAQWTPPQQSNCLVQRTPTHIVHRPAESPLAGSLIYELVEGG
jgi:hypothetical protein